MAMRYTGGQLLQTLDGVIHGTTEQGIVGCLDIHWGLVQGGTKVDRVEEHEACHEAGCAELFGFDRSGAADPASDPCEQCGFPNQPDARLCERCGHQLCDA